MMMIKTLVYLWFWILVLDDVTLKQSKHVRRRSRKFNMLYFKHKWYYPVENLWKDLLLGFLSRDDNQSLAGSASFDFKISRHHVNWNQQLNAFVVRFIRRRKRSMDVISPACKVKGITNSVFLAYCRNEDFLPEWKIFVMLSVSFHDK